MAGTETNVAERWLIARIKAANIAANAANPAIPILRVYNEAAQQVDLSVAPEAGELEYYPCVVVRLMTARADVQSASAVVLFAELVYLVEVIDRNGSLGGLEPLWKFIHPALHRQRGTTSDGEIIFCRRLNPFKKKDRDADDEYQRLGGQYLLGARCTE